MSIIVVAGGQFGSEAKGHVASILERRYQPAVSVRVGGPNAGHTVIDHEGDRYPLRHLPVAAIANPTSILYLAPGSEIDPAVLAEELDWIPSARERVVVSPQATVISEIHRRLEGGNDGPLQRRIGSTGKGVGAARSDRILRVPGILVQDCEELFTEDLGVRVQTLPAAGGDVLIEGTQGYGLGLHAGFYPYCTSGDCRPVDFVAQSGIPPSGFIESWLVFRTYPIRVAGNSGPLANEVSWEWMARQTGGYAQPEHTTVTKKIRRIGLWDPKLARDAVLAAGPGVRLALTFVDYLDPRLGGSNDWAALLASSKAWPWIGEVEAELGKQFGLFTTGPHSHIWRP